MTQNLTEGVTPEGLTQFSYNTLLENIQRNLTQIYGLDGETLNLDSETPDGQMTNILAQIGADIREVNQEIYNSFDPDKCSGSVQDSRYALNFITRKGGTFTVQNIDITVDRTVTLNGLDGNYNDVNATGYTVSDDAGNLWYLIDTTTLTTGTSSLPFRAKNLGYVQATIGTITNQVTTVLGVTNVINSVAPTTYGEDLETDAEFRIRRAQSTMIKGQNNLDALLGAILDLNGVSNATYHNNSTSTTDSTGTPAHTFWVIVEGGANADIANLIYSYSCGLPTRGAISVDLPTLSGQTFTAKFDRVNPVNLYIKFDLKPVRSLTDINTDGIAETLANELVYKLNEPAETSKITQIASFAINANGGGGYALNVQISTDGEEYTDFIALESLKDKFVIDSSNIDITVLE